MAPTTTPLCTRPPSAPSSLIKLTGLTNTPHISKQQNMSKHKAAIHWFTTGLRCHDNPALCAALASATTVFPVFCVDPHFTAQSPEYACGANRYRHLIESLADLDASLRRRGSRLLVARGSPDTVLPELAQRWGASLLTYERDTSTPFARRRDAAVCSAVARVTVGGGGGGGGGAKREIEVESFVSHTMYDPERLLALAGGDVTTTYNTFLKLLSRAGAVPAAVAAPSELNAPSGAAIGDDPAGKEWQLPTLTEAGFDVAVDATEASPLPGGETEALRRLKEFLTDAKRVRAFEKPKTAPTALVPETTCLSPYLKFGTLSVRRFWHDLHAVLRGASGRSQPPVSLDGQLLWREFYYFVGTHTPNFEKMKGNRICRQIEWNSPSTSAAAADALDAWKQGRTGFPWIDAAMTQLRRTGWIHREFFSRLCILLLLRVVLTVRLDNHSSHLLPVDPHTTCLFPFRRPRASRRRLFPHARRPVGALGGGRARI
jgi:cryptochrome